MGFAMRTEHILGIVVEKRLMISWLVIKGTLNYISHELSNLEAHQNIL
jgi:hypothetical protein